MAVAPESGGEITDELRIACPAGRTRGERLSANDARAGRCRDGALMYGHGLGPRALIKGARGLVSNIGQFFTKSPLFLPAPVAVTLQPGIAKKSNSSLIMAPVGSLNWGQR
jgi:hypothetical protein